MEVKQLKLNGNAFYPKVGLECFTNILDTSVTSGSSNLITSGAVYDAIQSIDPVNPGPTVTVDTAITSGSTNPVTSAAIYTALFGKVDKVDGKGLSTKDFTQEHLTKLDKLEVMPSRVGHDPGEMLTLGDQGDLTWKELKLKTINNNSIIGEGNITITTGGSITIDDVVTSTSNNAVSSKAVYNYVAANQGGGASYTLPTASTTTKGGIKVGSGLSISNEVLSAEVTASQLNNKVDKVAGKGLSTNDFTNELKTKLESLNTTGGNEGGGSGSSYTLPTASATTKGGIKVGSTLKISASDVLDVAVAVPSTSGVANNSCLMTYNDGWTRWQKILPDYTTDDSGKVLSINAAGTNVEWKTASGGSYTLPTASGITKGGVKIGTGLTMNGEVLSAEVTADDLANKVTKVDGKGLSTKDFTEQLQTKLNSLDVNRQVPSVSGWHPGDIITFDETYGVWKWSALSSTGATGLPAYTSSNRGMALFVNDDGSNVLWKTIQSGGSSDSNITVDSQVTSGSANAVSGDAVYKAIRDPEHALKANFQYCGVLPPTGTTGGVYKALITGGGGLPTWDNIIQLINTVEVGGEGENNPNINTSIAQTPVSSKAVVKYVQDHLSSRIDQYPVQYSTNLVTSGGVYARLAQLSGSTSSGSISTADLFQYSSKDTRRSNMKTVKNVVTLSTVMDSDQASNIFKIKIIATANQMGTPNVGITFSSSNVNVDTNGKATISSISATQVSGSLHIEDGEINIMRIGGSSTKEVKTSFVLYTDSSTESLSGKWNLTGITIEFYNNADTKIAEFKTTDSTPKVKIKHQYSLKTGQNALLTYDETLNKMFVWCGDSWRQMDSGAQEVYTA